MKISVIVPVYNVENYLDRCVKSILNQTHKDLELILVDDGSLDSSGEICDRYKKNDSRVIVIHKSNSGVSASRNIGIDSSTGKYILFVDSDDYIELNAIEIFVSNSKCDSYSIIINNYNRFYDDNTVIKNSEYKNQIIDPTSNFSSTEKFKYFFGRSSGTQIWNKFYETELIKGKQIYFNEKISVGEDFLFNFRVIQHASKILITNAYTYNYFIRPGSITSSFKKNLYQQNMDIIEELTRFSAPNDKFDDIISIFAFTSIDNIALNLLAERKKYIAEVYKILEDSFDSPYYRNAFKKIESNKYYKLSSRINWRMFVFIFTKLYNRNKFKLATLIMVLRHKVN